MKSAYTATEIEDEPRKVRQTPLSAASKSVGIGKNLASQGLVPILFEDVGDDFFRNGLLRREKQVINNGFVTVPHWQRIGNELKSGDVFQSLLKRFHNRVVVLFDKFASKKIALVAFGISSIAP